MNIAGLSKAKVLAALYNHARPVGMSSYDMDEERAEELLKPQEKLENWLSILDDAIGMAGGTIIQKCDPPLFFDRLQGRMMNIDLTSDEVDTTGYNEINGKDAAEKIIQTLREKNE